jgi:hypothetical protein
MADTPAYLLRRPDGANDTDDFVRREIDWLACHTGRSRISAFASARR